MPIVNPGTTLSNGSAFTLGGVFPVWELDLEETFDVTGGNSKKTQAVRTLQTTWDNRNPLIVFLLGGSYKIGGTPFYSTGHAYPYDPSLFCQKVTPKGDGLRGSEGSGNNQIISYERSILKATYVVPEWTFGSPNLIGTAELDYSNVTYATDSTTPTFQYTDMTGGDVPAALLPSFKKTIVAFNITRYSVPFINFPLVFSLIDCSNSVTFEGGDVQTVKFVGGRSSRKISASAVLGNLSPGDNMFNWDVTYSFIFQNGITWNQLYTPTGIRPFAFKNTGNLLYPAQDLNQLFQ